MTITNNKMTMKKLIVNTPALLLLFLSSWRVDTVAGHKEEPYAPPDKDAYKFIFPSAKAVRAVSPFDDGDSLFAPATLRDLYPEFEAPHFLQDWVPNSCGSTGVDRVLLELPAMADDLLDETVIGLALLVNDYYVAETEVSKTNPNIYLEDVIYPPITTEWIKVQLLVVSFDGQVDAGLAPAGVELLPHQGVPGLHLLCAPPMAVQGELYHDPHDATQKRILPDAFVGCHAQQPRTLMQYLTDQNRPGPRYPKPKFHQACTPNATRTVLLPIPNEPFQVLPTELQPFFDVMDSIFTIQPVPSGPLRDLLWDTLCGGGRRAGVRKSTVRMSHLQCQAVPAGWNRLDVTADFTLHCPEVRTATLGSGGKGGNSHNKEL